MNYPYRLYDGTKIRILEVIFRGWREPLLYRVTDPHNLDFFIFHEDFYHPDKI